MRLAPMKPSEIAKRRANVTRDVDLIESGWRPSEETMAAAPRIENWHKIPHPRGGGICLAGDVTGHPDLGSGLQITSLLVAYGPNWARTESRFYALGPRATETLEARVQQEREKSLGPALPPSESTPPATDEDLDNAFKGYPTY